MAAIANFFRAVTYRGREGQIAWMLHRITGIGVFFFLILHILDIFLMSFGPEVFNALLQILDDGRLTDGQGHVVDFRNTVLLMTSNIGTEYARKGGALGFLQQEPGSSAEERERHQTIEDGLKSTFRPEFINRVDEIIVFHSLGIPEIEKIVDILLAEVQERLSSYGLSLAMTPEAKQLLIEKGYDPSLGARPLRRTIQRLLEDPLAEEVLKNTFKPGSAVKACRKKDVLSFECKAKAKKEKVSCTKSKEKELEEKELQ